MEDLVKRMALALVDHQDQVSVKKIKGDRIIVYELRVAKEDLGKVIGQRGRNIDAMRTILAGASAKARMRSVLELIEEDLTRATPMPLDEPLRPDHQNGAGKREGVVKWFSDRRGYGFITSDDGEEVFVHYKSIKEHDQSLMEGDRVTFDVIEDEKGFKAINVTRIGS
jgi:cold shock CspA family protein/predicted RNA-binding protein YlqC (UPF0109 family)